MTAPEPVPTALLADDSTLLVHVFREQSVHVHGRPLWEVPHG